MVKLAFWYDRPQEYSGGINYLRNLLYAIAAAGDARVEPYIFFGSKVDQAIVDQFLPLATVVRTPVLDRMGAAWLAHKLLFKLTGSLFLVNRIMKKHGITVMSHAEHVTGTRLPYRLISWIPDFQYLHLPHLFPGLDSARQNAHLVMQARRSDVVVLSSFDALHDFQRIMPVELWARAKVLQFVSQPAISLEAGNDQRQAALLEKYTLPPKYFFLPNQFWHHKNHAVVFEAVHILKQQGKDITVVCSGNLRDYRSKSTAFLDGLTGFLEANGIQGHVRILGLISYDEVLQLMRNAVAVLNPSRFEGWSSSVEEAKSIGKKVVLSDIGVHREQLPADGQYFDPDDAHALAALLDQVWAGAHGGIDEALEASARATLHLRTVEYGRAYLALIDELTGSAGT